MTHESQDGAWELSRRDAEGLTIVDTYIENMKRAYGDGDGTVVENLFGNLIDNETVHVTVESWGSAPVTLATIVDSLMEDDVSRKSQLNWAYLRMYQRHWEYCNDGLDDVARGRLTIMDQFADATAQTNIHAPVEVDGSWILLDWHDEERRLKVDDPDTIAHFSETPSYVSIVANCRSDELESVTSTVANNLGAALVGAEIHGFNKNIEHMPLREA